MPKSEELRNLEEYAETQDERLQKKNRKIKELEAEVERLREAISKAKAELENDSQAGRRTAAAYTLLKSALDAAEDGGDENTTSA